MYSIKHPTHATARILSRGSGNKSLRLVMVINPFAWYLIYFYFVQTDFNPLY